MDINYLHKKLAEKSKAALKKELSNKVGDLNHIDGELISITNKAKIKIKAEMEQSSYANHIISIILDDLVDSRAEKRLEIDIDKFLKSTEEIRNQLNGLSEENNEREIWD